MLQRMLASPAGDRHRRSRIRRAREPLIVSQIKVSSLQTRRKMAGSVFDELMRRKCLGQYR